MAEMLRGLIPALFPEWRERVDWQLVPHEGKTDLIRSIPRKLRAWREPGVRFVVVHDQDQADCLQLKGTLTELCRDAGRSDTLVRIACRELEAWYLGDLAAVEAGLGVTGIAKEVSHRLLEMEAMASPAASRLTKRRPPNESEST